MWQKVMKTKSHWQFYPFPFHLEIIFSLEESVLKVEWQVTNTGKEALLYSIGGHPGFACPPNY